MDNAIARKLALLRTGEIVLISDEQMEAIEAEICQETELVPLRSLPNPKRCGTKDSLVAKIGEPFTAEDMKRVVY